MSKTFGFLIYIKCMIINHEYNNGKLILSYINSKGRTQFKNYPWNNLTQWKVCSDKDTAKDPFFHTWDNKPVKKDYSRYPNRYDIYEFLHKLPEEEKKEIFAYNEPKITFCDIEVEITDGFPEAHLANNKITAICLIRGNKILLMGLKELTDYQVEVMQEDINKYFKKYNTNYKLQWIYFESEYKMVYAFFNEYLKGIDVLTGWNFIGYDWVYFVTRARKLGINPNVASPTGKLIKPWKKTDTKQKPTFEELPKHKLVFDYMDIFDKWDTSIKIKESNSLDFVSSQVLGIKKYEYEGNLKDLYHKDWNAYCLYNCIDTALVQLIHNKQKTFDLMLALSNLAKIPIEDSVSAIRVSEGLFFDSYYESGIVMVKQRAGIVVTDNEDEDDDELELKGGYVKFPTLGIHNWISVFDFMSLYPTTMRQFNIGPDSYKGIKINDFEALLNGVKTTIEPNDIILDNNTVFINNDSNTKKIITKLFDDRKKNKNIALGYRTQGKLIQNYLNNKKKQKV